jgi:hypothetical protein
MPLKSIAFCRANRRGSRNIRKEEKMNNLKNHEREFKNIVMKEELIKRSLDIFAGRMSDEQRKKLLNVDSKAMGKYLHRTAMNGLTSEKK